MSDAKRVVIRAPNWLGDAVMALPAMGVIRRALPEAWIAMASVPSIAPLFDEITNAAQDESIVIRDPRAEVKTLAAGAFDTAILLPNSFRSALSTRRAGIAERWGYSSSLRGFLLSRRIVRPRGKVHQSAYYLELVRALGLDAPQEPPRITVRAETAARAKKIFDEYGIAEATRAVGFAPGAAYGHAKRWPPERVRELVIRLSRNAGSIALLFGAGGDRDAGREIESSLPPDVRVINLIGRTDLRLLAGLVARCAAFVSNDSGAMHLAGALGVPLVAIFGPTDERVTSPLGGGAIDGRNAEPEVLTHPVFCRPCMLRDCPIDHRCMKKITVDTVFNAVVRRLPAREAAG
ncbi:MAG TPA: lipopolysaccharide heptosyltransferase II [Vicinamibacterales bacterium]|jgi:heptosyltransferase-2